MQGFVIAPPEVPSVAVAGTDARFPVRRIYCIGRNYAEHAKEMGAEVTRDRPFFFCKPADAVVDSGATVPYPPLTANLHHEAELVVAIGAEGRNLPAEEALSVVWGYAAGNDLTRRDLQLAARDAGRPWDEGKAFDHSAACAPLHPVQEVGHPSNGPIRLTVNDEVRQEADLADMIWSVPELISALSHSVVLKPGDLIYTGTPSGVGPLKPGDRCVVTVAGLTALMTIIGEPG